MCNKGGCHIKVTECDQEFQSIMDNVTDEPGVDMNYANTQDCVASVECNDQTIEETVCTTHHCCNYSATPKQMIVALAKHSVNQLNVFPAKHDISEHCSPETVITGYTMDCTKQCQHEFRACAQANHKPKKKNDTKKCTIDAMCS